jgi:hypothetical protein
MKGVGEGRQKKGENCFSCAREDSEKRIEQKRRKRTRYSRTLSHLHDSLGLVIRVVRHVRARVEELSDAVAAVRRDDRALSLLRHLRDLLSEVPVEGRGEGKAREERLEGISGEVRRSVRRMTG